jgi:outer membrane protein insertion porin family
MKIKLSLLLIMLLVGAAHVGGQTPVRYSAADSLNYPMADYSAPKQYIVNNIVIVGAKYVDTSMLALSAGLNKGDKVYVPGDYVSSAIKSILGRKQFAGAEVVAQPVGDSINFEIYLQERPRVYKWDIAGIRKGQAKSIIDEMKLSPGTELSDYLLDKNEQYIVGYFKKKGYRHAEATSRVVNDSVYKNAVNVTFVVDKKNKVKIGDIVFEGNEVFPDKRLRRTLSKTHRKSINIFNNSKLREKEYAEDKLKLIDFYNSKGYRNAHIVRDSIYDINNKRIGINIKVSEGNKYYYRNITWTGNSKYDTETLNKMLGLHKGDIYDKKTMNDRLGINGNPEDMSITSLYQNDGYLFFRIEPAEVIIGADSIDLELKVFEGKQATINDVTITGNNRINDEVIRRELYTRPGELYDRSLLMATMRQLAQMRYFNAETILPNITTPDTESANIGWNLEESSTDQFEFSGGYGIGMFILSAGIQLNNLSIKNFFKKGAWRPYPSGQGQQLALRIQSNGQYYKGASLSFTEPWLGGKKPISMTIGVHYSDETDAYYVWQEGNKHFRTIGASVGIGRRLSWPDHYFTLYNELSYQSYRLKDWDNFIVKNGSSNIISLTTVFGRSSVDQPIYPRKGSDFSISVELTPPYSLFDGRDYSDPTMTNNTRYGWIEYHKWKFKGVWFTTLSKNQKLVLMTKVELGYLGKYNKYKQSPFEGFDVGGSGMQGYNIYGVDVVGMRGYDDSALTPNVANGGYANVYNKYTVELRYPIILKQGSQIYALAFAEAGNAYTGWNTFDPFSLKRSLGAGIRINLPMVGMLGIDWGYGFDRASGSNKRSGGKIAFVFGNQF